MAVVLWGSEKEIITSYLNALRPHHQVRTLSSLADVGDISEKELYLIICRDFEEMKQYREQLLMLAEKSQGAVVMLPSPWEVPGEDWAAWVQHKVFVSEQVPASNLPGLLEYVGLWLRNIGHYHFLARIFFILLSLKVQAEKTGVKDALSGIFRSLVIELGAKRGIILGCCGQERLEVMACDGFGVNDEVVSDFVNAFQGSERVAQKEEVMDYFSLLLRSMGYSCREEEINLFSISFQNKRLGWILLHGLLDSTAKEIMAAVSFYLGALMYIGQLEDFIQERLETVGD